MKHEVDIDFFRFFSNILNIYNSFILVYSLIRALNDSSLSQLVVTYIQF